ncbi:hypothetical protein J4442_04130 [Candidatus Woesearchaeota archaeon]|nr:hypothetical protein [Candidatus Woesearchaeota archaeon]
MKPGKTNKEDRLNFVEYWADFVKNNPEKVWSRQQNILINSQIKNARGSKLSKEDYLSIKQK